VYGNRRLASVLIYFFAFLLSISLIPLSAQARGVRNETKAAASEQPEMEQGQLWYLAEGYTGGDFDTYVLVQNPGTEDASVTLEFQLPPGASADPFKFNLAAGTRQTIHLDELPGLASTDVSTKVTGTKPVVVERATYFDYYGRDGGSCSLGYNTRAPTIIPPTTKVMGASDLQHLISISSDQADLTFNQPTQQILSLQGGDVLVFGVTDKTPYGLLRKVTGMKRKNSTLIVSTTQATLEDTFTQGEFSTDGQLTPSEATPDAAGVKLASSENADRNAQGESILKFVLDKRALYEKDGNRVTLSGTFSLKADYNFDASIKNGIELKFSVGAAETAELKLSSEVPVEGLKKSEEIPLCHFKPTTIWIGVVPLVFSPQLTLKIGINGTIEAGITSYVAQTASCSVGVKYKHGWHPLNNISNSFTFQPPQPSAECNVKVYGGTQFNIMLYGVVGPYANFLGNLRYKVGFFNNPWWQLFGGLEANVGVKVKVLGFKLKYNCRLFNVESILAQAQEASHTGTVAGVVKDALTDQPIENVKVDVYRQGLHKATIATDANGSFSVGLGATSGYSFVFLKTGYAPAKYENIEVKANVTTTLEPVMLTRSDSGPGDVSGKILSSTDGSGVSGMTVNLREGIDAKTGSIVATTTTGADGSYAFTNLTAGYYTAEAIGSEYYTEYFTVLCVGGVVTPNQNATVRPIAWQDCRGPGDGDAYALAYDTAHNILYRACNRGVWKYDGTTWSDTGGNISGGINTLVYDSTHNILYASTFWEGVWKYDGTTWTNISDDVDDAYSLAYDPNHNVLYVGRYWSGEGVWKYDGTTWSDTGGDVSGCSIDSLAYDAAHNVLYAGTSGEGVQKYDGTTWSNTGGDVSGDDISSLAYDASRNILYAGSYEQEGVWKYDGTTWSNAGGDVSSYEISSLLYDSSHNILYAGTSGQGVWKYDGTTWSDTNGPVTEYAIYALGFDSSHDVLYAGCYSSGVGVWKYGGTTWSNTEGGVSSYVITSLANDTAHGILYAGTEDEGVWKYDGTTWSNTTGDMDPNRITSLVYDASNDILYAGADDNGIWEYDGTDWSNAGGDVSGYRISSLLYDAAHNILYAGTYGYGVWKYDGATWSNTNGDVSGYMISSLAYDSSHNILYAGCYGMTIYGYGVWKYDGTTWSNTNGDVSGYGIESLAYDSSHDILYAGSTYGEIGVWKYDGTTWSNTNGDVSGYGIESLAYDSSHNILYAGCYDTSSYSSKGVWKYDGTTWRKTNGDVSGYVIDSLAYDSSRSKIYAGTSGMGVWEYLVR
jgi:hypothetical protein